MLKLLPYATVVAPVTVTDSEVVADPKDPAKWVERITYKKDVFGDITLSIYNLDDLKRVRDAGADAALVGTTLMRAADPAAMLAGWKAALDESSLIDGQKIFKDLENNKIMEVLSKMINAIFDQ